jgi:hypothetical protein
MASDSFGQSSIWWSTTSIQKDPYYRALEAADVAWTGGMINLSAMKDLLKSMLAEQLVAVHYDSGFGGE